MILCMYVQIVYDFQIANHTVLQIPLVKLELYTDADEPSPLNYFVTEPIRTFSEIPEPSSFQIVFASDTCGERSVI